MKLARLYILFIVVFISLSMSYGQKPNNKVSVFGIIKNYRNVIEIVDKDYTEPFDIANSERSFVPDSNGRFAITFTLEEPKYFRIARNSVYLSPGDKLEAIIDYEDARNASFRGSHSKENEYLKSIPYPKAGSYLEGGQTVRSTIEQTFYVLVDAAKQRKTRLDAIAKLSKDFKYLEGKRINADLLNSFYALRTYYPRVHKLTGDSLAKFQTEFLNKVDSFAKKYVPMDLNAGLMKLEVYRDVVPRILKLQVADSNGKEAIKIKDWFRAKGLIHLMQTDTANFSNQQIDLIKTPIYRKKVAETFNKFLSFNGTTAADLVLNDSKGNKIKLSSLRGKIIFIDVWATWCSPCIKEQPYLDSLINRFKDHSDIAFVSLSIDRNEADWLNYISKHQLSGIQWSGDISTLAPYQVSEIPRTILIDQNFKIYAMRGPMPSSAEALQLIEKMLQ
ncbi:TlpA family protein disulfide reductase [Flavisolibacter tropicus]|uniref:Thioredoxin domain-containing protein n=1 Tax=Flavisolibacter tropicus TaxID=1492898 RepID=A0A172TU60_9BACT|nr:TlpA disulfide reductase family protein [Flavisolibacter tropicus]ANE50313.1 hypothetical protein SY85_07150 [Flavisolibacter tropicus]